MPKQVTLSKFFVTKSSIPSNASTDDCPTTASTSKKKSNSKLKRKQPLNDCDDGSSSNPEKRPCEGSAFSTQPQLNGDSHATSNSQQKPARASLATNTLKKLSQFSTDCETSESDRHIRNHGKVKLNTNSSCNPGPSTSVCTPVCIDMSDDEVMDVEDGGSPSNHGNSPSNKSKASLVPSRSSIKYTPLEQQFVEIKRQYPDAVLFVECGYKYRFFGEDAEVAARVLKIFAHPDHNFMTASIPTHRLFVHVRRLVAAGHKVGVVKQTETAALKAAGSNKSAPFGRKLSALYTKSTLIGEVTSMGESESDITAPPTVHPNNYLMCVYDSPIGLAKSGKQTIGIVAVDPATGDVIHDCFEDGDTRAELEKRITHLQPVELLLPGSLSERTEKLIADVVALSSTDDDRIRLERLGGDNFLYSQAFETVSDFYSSSLLQSVVNLPKPVISCLSALIVYLKDFHLETSLRLTSNFKEFSIKSKYLQLGASTVHNLELFQNLTDGRETATLFWVINHTVSRFGGRQLRSWLANPLMDVSAINERLDGVEELCSGRLHAVVHLREVIHKLPDLEKGLTSIYHKKCSTGEFYLVSKALQKMYKQISTVSTSLTDPVKSALISKILTEVPNLLEQAANFANLISEKAARENDKPNLFRDETKFPEIVNRKQEIADVEQKLREYLREIRLTLKQPSLKYVTVLQTEFQVEVKNSMLKTVPKNWTKISSTKAVSRFHPPVVVETYKQLNQLREQLVLDATHAWRDFLGEFSEHYVQFQRAVRHIATLDCLLSLSTVAQQNAYCRPELLSDSVCLEVDQGRHPVIDLLKADHQQFVPNDTRLQADGERVMIITGPNMGGKSSYIRQVALIAIMAQIGSFVPANCAKIGVLDAIFTRMGAADEIFRGRSTFKVELDEAADVMTHATERSLVIMDELGRGTSTHDGVAIAYATLDYFIREIRCPTLFVTHYPMLSEMEAAHRDIVGNYHMSFLLHEEEGQGEASTVITFLYQLVRGAAAKSYGLNVARLADITKDIIKLATQKSAELEHKVLNKRKTMGLMLSCFGSKSDLLRAVRQTCTVDT